MDSSLLYGKWSFGPVRSLAPRAVRTPSTTARRPGSESDSGKVVGLSMSRMRPGPAGRRPGFIHSVRPLRTRGPVGRRRRRTGAGCDRSPGRDAWLDTLRTPGLPRRRRRPLVAVVSPLAARVHPRFALAGTEAPDCQTPVRDGPKGAVCYPSIDGPNRSPAGKTTRFEPSTGPTVPLGADK